MKHDDTNTIRREKLWTGCLLLLSFTLLCGEYLRPLPHEIGRFLHLIGGAGE